MLIQWVLLILQLEYILNYIYNYIIDNLYTAEITALFFVGHEFIRLYRLRD